MLTVDNGPQKIEILGRKFESSQKDLAMRFESSQKDLAIKFERQLAGLRRGLTEAICSILSS
jgi:hypothetical protein